MAVYQLGFPTCEWDSRDCIVSSLRHSECSLSEWKPSRAKASHHLSAPSLRRGPLRADGRGPKALPSPQSQDTNFSSVSPGGWVRAGSHGQTFPTNHGGGGRGDFLPALPPYPQGRDKPKSQPMPEAQPVIHS